jgi:hypothetical protein
MSCLTLSENIFCYIIISSPCQRQCELLPSLGIRRLSFVNLQEVPVVSRFDNESGRNVRSYRGPSIDASYQVSIYLTKWF